MDKTERSLGQMDHRKMVAPLALFVTVTLLGVVMLRVFDAVLPPIDQRNSLVSTFTSIKMYHVQLWLAGAWVFGRFMVIYILHGFLEWKRGYKTPSLFDTITSIVVVILAIAGILGTVFNQSTSAIIAASSAFTLVIGLALQGIILDLFSGMAIEMERPIKIDDWIQLPSGEFGKVAEINWRATRLVTFKNEVIVVPNGQITTSQIKNFSQPTPVAGFYEYLTLDYSVPPARARRILLSAVKGTKGVLEEPEPFVLVDKFKENGIQYWIGYSTPEWIKGWYISSDVAANIMNHLNQAGITVPYEQHQVYMSEQRNTVLEKKTSIGTLLKRVELFEVIPEDKLIELAQSVKQTDFPSGNELCRQGDEGDSLFVLVEGLLDIVVKGEDGVDRKVAQLQPGAFLGEMSLLTGSPRTATVKAAVDSVVIVVSRDDIEPILQENPSLMETLGELMATRQAAATIYDDDISEAERKSALKSKIKDLTGRIKGFFKTK